MSCACPKYRDQKMAANLAQIPLAGLSAESKHLISTLLNPPKVIPTKTGLLRDWRGLAQLCSLGGELLPAIATDPDPTNHILTIVQKRSEVFTLLSLKNALEKIGRWDIIDDAQSYLVRDAESYLERLQKSQNPAQENNFKVDKDILTIDDLFRVQRGEQSQHYDAFLLYADENTAFAMEMVQRLENQNNMKLCLKDRDLVAGISFEHEAIIRLISERCNRLILILSPAFFKSPANKFFVNFAQANSIDKQQERKIIPCIYEDCGELPPQLTYFSKIYYNKISLDNKVSTEFFWKKLVGSMMAVPPGANNSKNFTTRGIKTEKCEAKRSTSQNGIKQVANEGTVTADTTNKTESGERSRLMRLTGSRTFPFIKQARQESNAALQSSTSAECSINEEVTSDLPTIEGVDSLSSTPVSENTNNESKKKKKFLRKMQALLAK
ncbi:myeloid differentiation primary response protein MyD88 [Phymastichus coffea]|uniref:myeloid differentiation primary response protein MyD88 n=1 Tax=Phymastichus coffea TaxID=108790 RepID=UPI00273B90A8|nr:myeloid differentiation primary response protein MyD88 [Phymastichus coffea]